MTEKNSITILENRFSEFIKAIKNGEYKPTGYEFTIKFNLCGLPESKILIIRDFYEQ